MREATVFYLLSKRFWGKISNGFTINVIKSRHSRNCKFFSNDLNAIDTNSILDIFEYLMKKG